MNLGILLWLLLTLNVVMLIWGFTSRKRVYRYSVFSAAVFMGFAIPQLIGLAHEDSTSARLPEGALDMTLFMSFLCMGALWFGDHQGNAHPGSMAIHSLDEFNQNRIL